MHFVGSKISFHVVQKYVYYYVTYCNQQSLSRCITCRRCLQQSHAAKRLPPQLEVNICWHVTVTQWRSIWELSASKFRNLPLQAMQRTWVNCKLKIAWHNNSETALCAAWVSYRKIKLSLQELSQLSCWLQVFYKFLILCPNFHVVANSHIVPPADTHEHRGMPSTGTSHQLYLFSLIIK